MAYLKKRERTDTLDKAFKFDDEESVERYLIQMPKINKKTKHLNEVTHILQLLTFHYICLLNKGLLRDNCM